MSLSDGNMKVNINNNVTYLTFPVYDNLSFIKHCFSTRLGGVSKGIFESMNLSFNRGDADENVKENYIRISKAIGVNPYKMCIRDRNNKTLTHYIIRKEDEPKEYYYVFYSIDTDKNQITYCVSYSERSTEPYFEKQKFDLGRIGDSEEIKGPIVASASSSELSSIVSDDTTAQSSAVADVDPAA